MTDFRVVPQALHDNVKFLQEAADAWSKAHGILANGNLDGNDLGLLGKSADIVRCYNDAHSDIVDSLSKGAEILEQAAKNLKAVADEFQSREAEYYRQFGYVGS